MANETNQSTVANPADGSRDLFGMIRDATDAMKRVALIRRGNEWGTGFLVGVDLLLTNRHVLDSDQLQGFKVTLDYVQAVADIDIDMLPTFNIKESLALSPREDLDFQLVRLDRAVEPWRGFFTVSTMRPHEAGRIKVMIFGFPNDKGKLQPLQFIPGEVTTYINQPVIKRLGYSAQTQKGSSGSPIVSLTGNVIGLHHWQQKGFESFGMPMFAILDAMPNDVRAQLNVVDDAVALADIQRTGFQSAELAAEVAQISERVVPKSKMAARAALLRCLNSLDEIQFDQILTLLDADRPPNDRATASVGLAGPVAPRVPRLLNWVGTPSRPGVFDLLVVLEMLSYKCPGIDGNATP